MSTTLKPRETNVVIYQGDDVSTIADLRRAAELAERLAKPVEGAPKRLGDGPDEDAAQAAKDAYDKFVDEAAERAVIVGLRAIGRRRFRDLMAEHPPRRVTVKVEADEDEGVEASEREDDHPDDDGWGVNTTTFPDALLTYIDPDDPTIRTIAAPEFNGRKAVAAFVEDELAEGDFDGLWVTAYYLNRSPSHDPKAARFSPAHRSSTET